MNLSVLPTSSPTFSTPFKGKVKLDYPQRGFDRDALALYWYAKSTKNMPLQKYLAFYQVLEFFYPLFTKASARKRLKNLLLDPSLDIDDDRDLNRILSILEADSQNSIDERSQLNATLAECVDPVDLKEYFEPKKTRDFFLKKDKEITEVVVPLNDKKADIIRSVGSRVYDIRCRIVHTKDLTGVTKPLLPNSEGVEKLRNDIDLLEFLARKVIIAASSPLTI